MATERIEIGYEPLSNIDYPKFHHSFFIYTDMMHLFKDDVSYIFSEI